MFQLLFAVLIIYLLYVLWKRAVFRKKTTIYKSYEKHDLTPGEMVSCAKCRTFVLRNEAVGKGGKYYCSTHCVP